MEVVPASYTPVPGLVEGLHQIGKLGPVCSVACGRFYTAVALEPYTGPKLEELEAKSRARKAKAEAVARALRERNAREERELAARRAAERRELIAFLNASYPGCKACRTPWECAGFVADVFRPTFCILCGHERDQHSLTRDYNDEAIDNDMLSDFRDQVLAASAGNSREADDGGDDDHDGGGED